MKIKFLGAAREVGRSCIVLELSDVHKIMLDAGVKLTQTGVVYPLIEVPDIKEMDSVNAIFLSHAHLDHVGSLPYIEHLRVEAPIYATSPTIKLGKILLEDAYKIENHKNKVPYKHADLEKLSKYFQHVRYNKTYEINVGLNKIEYEFVDAGHIQGSASIFLKIKNKNEEKITTLIYTGDINSIDTQLLEKHYFYREDSDIERFKEVDCLILESTYSDKEHENRELIEKKFIETLKLRQKAGPVIVATFGVQRAQELLTLFEKNKLFEKYNIYLDGMAVKTTNTFLSESEFIINADLLRKAFRKVNHIHGFEERRIALKKRGIYITTSGMLSGGPVMSYLKELHDDPNTTILLTGYQCEGTNGRTLLELGYVEVDGRIFRPKCYFEKFDLSGHAGHKDLVKLVEKLKPKKVILNHGDESSILNFEKELLSKDVQVIAPKINEEIEL
ncbi:MAG: MBL fold metallo-hydrolase [Candidatus Nanoarchaeia archaeon]|nr:MBL fold metallo-hydrolase [Candidatus Nanoarchaeia archaeon]